MKRPHNFVEIVEPGHPRYPPPVRVTRSSKDGPPVEVTVHRRALPFGRYVIELYYYLRRHGWPRRHPLAILARAFREEATASISRFTFRGMRSLRDSKLGAHELGHEKSLPHTVEPNTLAGIRRAIFDKKTRTIMHPWGIFRTTDPDGLVEQWERAVDEAEQLPRLVM